MFEEVKMKQPWITIRTTLSAAEATVVERTLRTHGFEVRASRTQLSPFGDVPIDIAVLEGRAVEAVLFLAQFLRRDRRGRLQRRNTPLERGAAFASA
jgi:hypothetical protein